MSDLSRVESIFLGALEKSDPLARAAFLDEACQGEDELRRQVARLLLAHSGALNYLVPPEADATRSVALDLGPVAERSGAVIGGRYKLLEPIGEGGMGTVWMAQQTEPVRRTVALKLIKAGMDTKAVLTRFSPDGRFLVDYRAGGYEFIDTVTEKTCDAKVSYQHQPGRGWAAGTFRFDESFRRLPRPGRLAIPPDLLELWLQVAVRGELDDGGDLRQVGRADLGTEAARARRQARSRSRLPLPGTRRPRPPALAPARIRERERSRPAGRGSSPPRTGRDDG